jgi:hypothetical protein
MLCQLSYSRALMVPRLRTIHLAPEWPALRMKFEALSYSRALTVQRLRTIHFAPEWPALRMKFEALSYFRALTVPRGGPPRVADRTFQYNRSPALRPEPPVRFELTTARLRIECSTPELRWRSWSRGESNP